MKKIIYLAIFLTLISFSNAALQCDTVQSTTCPAGQTKILGLSSQTNAHAELYNKNIYGWSICCNEDILDESCSNNNVVLKLSADTNAHVGFSAPTYPESLCLNADCYLNIIPASEEDLTGYDFIFSISNGITNAHIAGDQSYEHSLYCKSSASETLPVTCEPNDPGDENTEERCSDGEDNDCDTYIDLNYPDYDLDCVPFANCANYEGDDPSECRSLNDLCYYTQLLGCQECIPGTKCWMFDNENDCISVSQNCLTEGSGCSWDDVNGVCNTACANDEDGDTVCDDSDNCISISNPEQKDSDEDGIGDACDEDTDESGMESVTCSNLLGSICQSNQNCMWGHFVRSSDSSYCCLYGTCGITQLSLDGSASYLLDSSDCIDPNEDGIGKKLITKLQNGAPTGQQWEEDCSSFVLEESVPFYGIMSMLLTVLLLFGFYYRRLK